MATYKKRQTDFDNHLNQYIQTNGIQTPLQVKQLAKDFAIQSRNGLYDLTARKRYCSLFITYCFKNNIQFPFEGLPEGWTNNGVCFYDPDSEFTDDIRIQRLIRDANKRIDKIVEELCKNMDVTPNIE
jgi:hypothetical protein